MGCLESCPFIAECLQDNSLFQENRAAAVEGQAVTSAIQAVANAEVQGTLPQNPEVLRLMAIRLNLLEDLEEAQAELTNATSEAITLRNSRATAAILGCGDRGPITRKEFFIFGEQVTICRGQKKLPFYRAVLRKST